MADLLDRRRIGLMCQPASNPPKAGWLWAADNGCFSDKWDVTVWRDWLARDHPRAGCLFAVVPDVVADAWATRKRFDAYDRIVQWLRYPVAYAAQDGFEQTVIPWDRFDCLFIGGSTSWKLSETARDAADEARARGKWVHVGRVNSNKRFQSWASHADSCDGTFLAFGPSTNTPKLVRWLDKFEHQPQLRLDQGTDPDARHVMAEDS